MTGRRDNALLRLLLAVCGAVVLILLAAGCGSDDEKDSSQATTPAPAPASSAATPTAPAPSESTPAPAPGGTVTLETSQGVITFKLANDIAPLTTSRFASLVVQGFYNGLTFHRLEPGFVIQGGDPKGNGTGGTGTEIVEAPPSDFVYKEGTVAMAKTATDPPGTSDSQFFICTGSGCSSLQPEYAVVGQVTEGQDVVDKISQLPVNPSTGLPQKPVKITSATISA